MGIKALLIGEGDRYNYVDMMIPNNPFSKAEKKKQNFYSLGKDRACHDINISIQYQSSSSCEIS